MTSSAHFDLRVDSYLEKTPLFAQPILRHLRDLVHRACPEVRETVKWSRPFFEHRGAILCNMAAFKEHCSFGFWGEEMGEVVRRATVVRQAHLGSLRRITSLADLPTDVELMDRIRQAAGFIENGEHTSPLTKRRKVAKPRKAELAIPPELASALSRNKAAEAVFAAFSTSCKREYVEWIAEAKQPATRERRLATALEWIAEGKQRHWKYQNC